MLEFRAALIDESDTLSRLAITSKGYWGYPKHLLAIWKNDLRIEKDYINENIVRTIWRDSELIGFFALKIGDENELEHLWLLPEVIGKGFGEIAFEEVRRIFWDRGITTFFIVSDPHAEKFYIRQGAQRIGEVESIPQNRFLPKLKMELP